MRRPASIYADPAAVYGDITASNSGIAAIIGDSAAIHGGIADVKGRGAADRRADRSGRRAERAGGGGGGRRDDGELARIKGFGAPFQHSSCCFSTIHAGDAVDFAALRGPTGLLRDFTLLCYAIATPCPRD